MGGKGNGFGFPFEEAIYGFGSVVTEKIVRVFAFLEWDECDFYALREGDWEHA